jgi:hypothetical protein
MENKKTENCMICGEELAYLTTAIPVTCTYCGKAESANIHCPSGHYVCNECHASDSIKIITQFCLSSSSKNPMEMAKTIMRHPIMPMHGPEHHAMIAGVLVTAYKNLTGKVTDDEIKEAIRRGATVPGGYCGLYGADAAAIATGIAISTILKASPLTDYERRTANMMTSRALAAIASNRGARCCKRSTYVALDLQFSISGKYLELNLNIFLFRNSNASIVPEIRLAHGLIADFMPERRFNMKNQTVVHNE